MTNTHPYFTCGKYLSENLDSHKEWSATLVSLFGRQRFQEVASSSTPSPSVVRALVETDNPQSIEIVNRGTWTIGEQQSYRFYV